VEDHALSLAAILIIEIGSDLLLFQWSVVLAH
jgi:hypothetical protein